MPCTYDESAEEIAAREAREREQAVEPFRKQIDLVTRMLCGLLTKLEETGALTQTPRLMPGMKYKSAPFRVIVVATPGHGPGEEFELDEELSDWWRTHKKMDAARTKRELRKAALAKLTTAEIDALDLDDDL